MLQIIHVATPGGAEKNTRLISKAFKRLGINVTLVHQPGAYAAEYATLKQYGVDCIEFDLKQSLSRSLRFVRAVLKQKKIDLIHSHMHGADFIAAFARKGLKGICHFSTIHFLPQDNPGLAHRLKSTVMTAMAFHNIHKIFAPSVHVAKRARREFLLPRDRVVVALNSIDFEEMQPHRESAEKLRKAWKSGKATRLLVYAGAFYWVKGHACLIKAMARLTQQHPEAKLVLLGEGEEEQGLRALVRDFGLEEQVLFAGHQRNIADWLSIADVYVQPSLRDCMPRALLEAMYMGLPVVASDLETIREVVDNGRTGVTVPARSPERLAEGIAHMLENPQAARGMATRARQFVSENCSMDTMARKMLQALNVTPGDAGAR
jgi:glycosyltransferase involved in cell wall biosynthesis